MTGLHIMTADLTVYTYKWYSTISDNCLYVHQTLHLIRFVVEKHLYRKHQACARCDAFAFPSCCWAFCLCFKVQSRCRWLKDKNQITDRGRGRGRWRMMVKPRGWDWGRGLAHMLEKSDMEEGGGRMGRGRQESGSFRLKVKRKRGFFYSVFSCVTNPAPVSFPGLVEEDVSWLRVLRDVGGKAIKLLNGLGINFLHNKGMGGVNWWYKQ